MSKVLASWSGKVGAAAVLAAVGIAWKWHPALSWDTASVTWLVPVFLAAWGLDKLIAAADAK